MKRPLFAVGAALLSAMSAAAFLGAAAAWWVVAGGSAGLLLFVALRRRFLPADHFLRRRAPLPLVMACILLAAVGVFVYQTREPALLRGFERGDYALRGHLSVDPVSGDGTLTVHTAARAGEVPRAVRPQFKVRIFDFEGSLPGNADVEVICRLSLPAVSYSFDSRLVLRGKGIFFNGTVTEYSSVALTEPNLQERFALLQSGAIDAIRRFLPGEEGAVAAGMATGNALYIPPDLKRAYGFSGLSHILAVSGSHLVILAGVLLGLLRMARVGLRARMALTLAVLGLFTLLCGAPPSAVRSFFMAAVGTMGIVFRRDSDALSALGAAVTAMLALDPLCASDLGFLFSVGSTLGLILAADAVAEALGAIPLVGRLPQPVLGLFAMTLSATVFILPVTSAVNNRVSLLALFSNLLGNLLSAPIILFGALTALAGPLFEPLGYLFAAVAGLSAKGLNAVVRVAASARGLMVFVSPAAASALLLALCAALLARRQIKHPSKRFYRAAVCAFLALCLVLRAGQLLLPSPPAEAVFLDDGAAAVALVEGGEAIVAVRSLQSGLTRDVTRYLLRRAVYGVSVIALEPGDPQGCLPYLAEHFEIRGYSAARAEPDLPFAPLGQAEFRLPSGGMRPHLSPGGGGVVAEFRGRRTLLCGKYGFSGGGEHYDLCVGDGRDLTCGALALAGEGTGAGANFKIELRRGILEMGADGALRSVYEPD